MSKSLLPTNTTPLERALESATREVLAANDQPVRDIADALNPLTCREELLPSLGEMLGVPLWNGAWPENNRREMVAASIPLRMKAGTAWAVKEALQTLGIAAELTTKPDFAIEIAIWADLNRDQAEADLVSLAERVVDVLKPVRCKSFVYQGARIDAETQVYGAVSVTDYVAMEWEEIA